MFNHRRNRIAPERNARGAQNATSPSDHPPTTGRATLLSILDTVAVTLMISSIQPYISDQDAWNSYWFMGMAIVGCNFLSRRIGERIAIRAINNINKNRPDDEAEGTVDRYVIKALKKVLKNVRYFPFVSLSLLYVGTIDTLFHEKGHSWAAQLLLDSSEERITIHSPTAGGGGLTYITPQFNADDQVMLTALGEALAQGGDVTDGSLAPYHNRNIVRVISSAGTDITLGMDLFVLLPLAQAIQTRFPTLATIARIVAFLDIGSVLLQSLLPYYDTTEINSSSITTSGDFSRLQEAGIPPWASFSFILTLSLCVQFLLSSCSFMCARNDRQRPPAARPLAVFPHAPIAPDAEWMSAQEAAERYDETSLAARPNRQTSPSLSDQSKEEESSQTNREMEMPGNNSLSSDLQRNPQNENNHPLGVPGSHHSSPSSRLFNPANDEKIELGLPKTAIPSGAVFLNIEDPFPVSQAEKDRKFLWALLQLRLIDEGKDPLFYKSLPENTVNDAPAIVRRKGYGGYSIQFPDGQDQRAQRILDTHGIPYRCLGLNPGQTWNNKVWIDDNALKVLFKKAAIKAATRSQTRDGSEHDSALTDQIHRNRDRDVPRS